ncbi:MAG: hypothetical protein R2771_09950 [Saprospiraceae bacterium]
MTKSFFEYTKTILEKVSFDKELFRRELQKASKLMLPTQKRELFLWLKILITQNPHLAGMETILVRA